MTKTLRKKSLRPSSQSFDETRRHMLADPAVAKTYLEECLADGDPELFMAALKYVAEAQGGMGKLARKAKLSRETLYRTLSVSGNPRLDTLTRILSSLGLQLSLKNIAVRAARP